MKKRNYLVTLLIALSIIMIIYFIKGIYPFGNNYAIWSDMHDQVVAMYYHFWDSIRGESSLMIAFSTGGGINFIGLIGYYILSPFTLLVLLVSRDNIVHIASVIVALKLVASSVTVLYCINKFFEKLPTSYKIFLSILYAFCGYVLISYVITAWMDAVYLLPLIAVGLKKLLDLEDTKMYIITVSLLLIFSFYIAAMTLIFIVFVSTLYMHLYKNKEERKQIALRLGISTIICFLCSSIILVPTLMQLSVSARVNTSLDTMLTLLVGPLYDKASYFFASGIAMAMTLLLLFKTKIKNVDKLFIIIVLTLLSIPVFIEPVNKVWHLSSYTGFPYRFGIITMLALSLVSAYYLNNMKEEKTTKRKMQITSIVTIIGVIAIFIITKLGYNDTQFTINKLTLTFIKKGFFVLFAICLITTLVALTILYLNKNKSKFTLSMLSLISIACIMSTGLLYVGIDHDQENLQNSYEQMLRLANGKEQPDNYYLKNTELVMTRNYGMVSKYNSLVNFSSLIDNNNFETLQRLGYDSYSMDTESVGGTLFTDTLLAQKYLISDTEVDNEYYSFKKSVKDLNFYAMKNNMSYGYLIDEIPITSDTENSFNFSNIIYNSITNKSELFKTYDDFNLINIRKEEEAGRMLFIKGKEEASLEKTFKVDEKKRLYLEIFDSFDFRSKFKRYKTLTIKVNGKTIEEEFPRPFRNGVLDLGTFENEEVTISINIIKDCSFQYIVLGEMDIAKYEDFANNYKINPIVEMNKNTIDISINAIEEKILFLPITYHENYKMIHNGNEETLLKVYDNYIGIKLNVGENNIKITYTSPGIKTGLIITVIGIVLGFIWIKYLSKVNIHILNKVAYAGLMSIATLLIIVIYIIPSFYFVKTLISKFI